MEFNTPYNRQKNRIIEDTEEKIRKRKEIQDWVFGNNFPNSGNNVIVSNNNNLYSYKNNYDNNIQYNANLQLNPINNMNTYPLPYLYINPTNNASNYLNNNINNNLYSNNLQNYQNNSVSSFFDLNTSQKDLQKKIEKDKYRNELKRQMEEDRQRAINKKKQLEEQNRIDEIKNEEYYLQKEKQEEAYEQLRKLKKNRKLKSQFGIDGNILTISNDNKYKINSQSIDNSTQNIQEENKTNEQIQNNNNYQSPNNIRGYPRSTFEEKEELKNYVDQQYNDLFKSVEILIDNQKLYGANNLSKTFEQQRYLNNSNNFNNMFRFPKLERKVNYKDEMKKYYISNDVISKKVENDYDYIFKELSDLDNLTKNYKRKMSPKIFYDDNKKDNFNSLIKNYDIKNKYKIKVPQENEENKEEKDKTENKIDNVENKENIDNQEINGVKESIENQGVNEPQENVNNQGINEAKDDNGDNEANSNNLQTNKVKDENNYSLENNNNNSDLNKGFYDIKEDEENNSQNNAQIKEEMEGQKENEIENNNKNINEENKNDDNNNIIYESGQIKDIDNPNINDIKIKKEENNALRYENKEKEEDEYEYEEVEDEEEEEEEAEAEAEN